MERGYRFALIVISLSLSYSATLPGQSVFRGRVIDMETREPLAFVNIVYNERGTGTTTNLDGYFTIESGTVPPLLKLSYVGYEPVTFQPLQEEAVEMQIISMTRKPYMLEEVTVFPDINPAHRIIDKAYRNRRLNNPEMLPSFSYKSYNKLYFTMVPDSLVARVSLPGNPDLSRVYAATEDSRTVNGADLEDAYQPIMDEPADSGKIRRQEFFEKQHLFLMESISERQYRRPGRNNEKVTASRVSGFQDPSFTLLATQLQSFSFYGDFISLLDRNYLSPLSRGSTSRYSFILEDSLFTGQNDTLFVISFRPYRNRNFDGLQGVVYINSNLYAVQHVIAEPYERRGIFNIRVRQNYDFIDGRQWFPVELNTDIILGGDDVQTGSDDSYSLAGIGKAYLSEIVIEPELRRRHFNNIELTVAPDAHRRTDEYWNEFRVEPLSEKELTTYHVIDSIGREVNLDRSLRIFEAVATGYIPWGIFNVNYAGLLDYNYFEGLRPGIRLMTNDRISEWFSTGGYIAYGSRDRVFKYGLEAGLSIYRPAEAGIRFSWSNDVEEAGSYNFLEKHQVGSTEGYRRFMIGRKDFVENYRASADFRFMRHFKGSLYFSDSRVRSGDGYIYLRDGNERDVFRFPEAGARVRFAWREKFMQTPRGNRISMGTDFPVLWFNYGRGLGIDDGYEYTRLQAGLYQGFLTRQLGRTSLTIEAGVVEGDVPLFKLYTGKGSFRSFSMEAANSFGTMRMEEFFSDRFVSFFFRQNFESLLFRSGKFRPEIVFITNAGFGRLANGGNHLYTRAVAPEKGFYESGLLINDLYKRFFAGYGLGVFYRYGPYAFDRPIDNFAFKLTFGVSLR